MRSSCVGGLRNGKKPERMSPVSTEASATASTVVSLQRPGFKRKRRSIYVDLALFAGCVAIGVWLIVIGATSGLGALIMAGISSRPFRKLFVTQQAQRRASLVGKMCTVLSARVDGNFGRAEIEDGGAGFVAEVRCPQDNGLIRGAQALVYRYEPSDGIFFIGPVDAALTEAAEIAEES